MDGTTRRFMQIDAEGWIAGTVGLTPAERGVLITALAMIAINRGPIVKNIPRITRVFGFRSEEAFTEVLDYLISIEELAESDGMIGIPGGVPFSPTATGDDDGDDQGDDEGGAEGSAGRAATK